MESKFTIGQLASLFGINIQTLYYYDKIGLFSPISRDNITNVRVYSFEQIYKLSTILYLRKLNMSIVEIKNILNNLTPQSAQEILTEKSTELRNHWEEMIRVDNAIHRKLEYVEREKKLQKIDEDKIVYRKKRKYINMGEEAFLYSTDSFYFYPTVAIYSPTGKTFGALLENEPKDLKITNDNITTIKNGNFLIAYHQGPYETIPEHREQIINNRKDLSFTGYMYNFNIFDQFNSHSPNLYLTRMEFQLSKEYDTID